MLFWKNNSLTTPPRVVVDRRPNLQQAMDLAQEFGNISLMQFQDGAWHCSIRRYAGGVQAMVSSTYSEPSALAAIVACLEKLDIFMDSARENSRKEEPK